jgi:DNA-binding response OmpR family regulator
MKAQKLDFGKVGILLGDPSMMIRQGLKGALFTEGFRDILDTDKLLDIREVVTENRVDLLICDVHLPEGDVFQFISDIRHHMVGNNPFLIIIALIDTPDPETVARVIDAGFDDILLKPISGAKLMERINLLVRKRKPFVVTTDYIGPTRRADLREDSMVIPEIKVPNPVKIKAEGQFSLEALQRAVDTVASMINEQKMERHAFQVEYLANIIVPLYETGTVDMGVVEHLDRLRYVSEDISRRQKGTAYSHVSDLCDSLLGVINSILAKPLTPLPQDIKLLPQLAKAVKRAFETTDDAVAVARDISDSLRKRSS